jgi:hypothetical protein
MLSLRAGGRREQGRDFRIVGLCLVVMAVFAVYPSAYLLVVIPAILPLYLWLRAGTPGIPTLPIIAGLFIIYYAAPVFRGDVQTDDLERILGAIGAVAGFLLSATLVYQPLLRMAARKQRRAGDQAQADILIVELMFMGLASGILFYVAFFSGWLDWLGSFVGVARAVGLTFASIGCYLAGAARARGRLRGSAWAIALLGLGIVVAFSMNGLLLVGGIVSILASVLGYVVTARRIPWLSLIAIFAVITVLQAGKAEMREKYWDTERQMSVSAVPATTLEWFEDGVNALWSGNQGMDVLERASLLWVVLRVQEATPNSVPYLNGETYALLPSIMMPRFVEPEKTHSQAGLHLLSVRYHLQFEEDAERTTIGFGLVAEAYANFGLPGVLAVGAFFGALCGVITWFSTGISPVSVRMFVAIAATTILLNVEADLSYLLVTMLQGVAGVLLAASVPALASVIVDFRSSSAAVRRRGSIGEGLSR